MGPNATQPSGFAASAQLWVRPWSSRFRASFLSRPFAHLASACPLAAPWQRRLKMFYKGKVGTENVNDSEKASGRQSEDIIPPAFLVVAFASLFLALDALASKYQEAGKEV
nr:hypothetical protein CFP56_11578 [Quercus suber]